jgi:1-acyl-sn-glycerol-3-phosphate acyltransferase
MLSALRALWRMAWAVQHLLQGMATIALYFGKADQAQRHAHIRRWSAGLLRKLGLRLELQGQWPQQPVLLVANHISWLDIAAIHAACPQARFVSKADVLAWPLVGWLVREAGTLFIERTSRRDAMRVLHQMTAALEAGDTVAVFPEGTTGPGPELLPLHANLLQAAISANVPLAPVLLRFSQPGQTFSSAAQFLGQTTLLQSFWRVASTADMAVHVHALPLLPGSGMDRRALCARLAQVLGEALQERVSPR